MLDLLKTTAKMAISRVLTIILNGIFFVSVILNILAIFAYQGGYFTFHNPPIIYEAK